MKRWIDYLANERAYKLDRKHALGFGWARLRMTADGVTRDVTDEELERLREDVADIEQIFDGRRLLDPSGLMCRLGGSWAAVSGDWVDVPYGKRT